MKIDICVISDIGLHRQNNEDNFYVDGIFREDVKQEHIEYQMQCNKKQMLTAVFDGMGGEENGEEASLEAACLLHHYEQMPFADICRRYIYEANEQICNTMSIMDCGRMGSTVSIAHYENGFLNVCNLGDSPVYLFRQGRLQQISVNHNEAQSLYDMGMITKQQMSTSWQKHRLTQHLGIFADEMIIEPYCKERIALCKKDYVLMCSDGLSDMVTEKGMEMIMNEGISVSEKAHKLVQGAIENGGRDNITLVLTYISETAC